MEKCRNKLFKDRIYNFEVVERNKIKLTNNNGFQVMLSRNMFDRCYELV
jgi:hypothetical protein